jgi:hypothetical protein
VAGPGDKNRGHHVFRHIPRPLDTRQILIGKRICVHGVPLDTIWFCRYCCATVDTAFVTCEKHPQQDAYIRSPGARLLGYSRPLLPFGGVPGRNHEERCAGCIVSLATSISSAFSASRPATSRKATPHLPCSTAHKRLRTTYAVYVTACCIALANLSGAFEHHLKNSMGSISSASTRTSFPWTLSTSSLAYSTGEGSLR